MGLTHLVYGILSVLRVEALLVRLTLTFLLSVHFYKLPLVKVAALSLSKVLISATSTTLLLSSEFIIILLPLISLS